MTLMFSDRIRVVATVCNETENYGKDDNWTRLPSPRRRLRETSNRPPLPALATPLLLLTFCCLKKIHTNTGAAARLPSPAPRRQHACREAVAGKGWPGEPRMPKQAAWAEGRQGGTASLGARNRTRAGHAGVEAATRGLPL